MDSPLKEELFEVDPWSVLSNVRMPGDKRSVILERVQRVRLIELFQEGGVLLPRLKLCTRYSEAIFSKRDDRNGGTGFDLSKHFQ